ncbi:MAG: TonB-dependent receptor, partial [Steroidobacteraceae bacterium]
MRNFCRHLGMSMGTVLLTAGTLAFADAPVNTDNPSALSKGSPSDSSTTGTADTGTADTGETGAGLEEVVVTASKRPETLQNVPGGVTALTSDALTNLGVVSFQDYLPYVPGLTASIGGGGGTPGYYQIIMRGLSSGPSSTTSTVGYYLDETPLTPGSTGSQGGVYAPDPDVGDVERVEVLKGPQGTLYGASTLGGLIKIVTKKPDLTNFDANFSAGGVAITDGGAGYSTRGAVNVPVIPGMLALRLSAYDREDPGFVDNVFTGQKDINSDHAHGGTLKLRYQPIDKLDVEVTGLIQNLDSAGNTQEYISAQTLQPIYGHDNISTFFNSGTSNQLTVFSLTANYDTGIGTLTNSLGDGHTNIDFARFPFTYGIDPLLLPKFGQPLDAPIAANAYQHVETKKVTDELRFNSTRMGHFEWQLAAYYTHEDADNTEHLLAQNYPSDTLFATLAVQTAAETYRDYAGSGDLTYYFTDTLDATVGTRYTRNKQDGVFSNTGLLGLGEPFYANTYNASSESYLFDLRWRASQQLSTYARVASAYRPGGLQNSQVAGAPNSFNPDTAWNYELGGKGRWLDGQLNTNLDVYYIDWRNIQLQTTVGGFAVIANGGDAKSEGVEFDGSYEPIRGLVLGANAAYNDAVLRSAIPNNKAGAEPGDPLPFAPKWTGALTGDYNFPLAQHVKGGAGASWAYTGARFSSFSGDLLDTRVRLPYYSTLNLRGHVDWSQYSISLHVDNVTNEQTYN